MGLESIFIFPRWTSHPLTNSDKPILLPVQSIGFVLSLELVPGRVLGIFSSVMLATYPNCNQSNSNFNDCSILIRHNSKEYIISSFILSQDLPGWIDLACTTRVHLRNADFENLLVDYKVQPGMIVFLLRTLEMFLKFLSEPMEKSVY